MSLAFRFIHLVVAILFFITIPIQAETPQVFELNPESLRIKLIQDSRSIQAAQLALKRAKLNVESARARLFPSLNLGVVAGTMANPSFVLASVDYVLPFLIPSRWFDVKKAKHLQQAEKHAFYTTELNLLASSYALILNIQNDLQTMSVLDSDLQDTLILEDKMRRDYEVGFVSETDYLRAQSQSASLKAKVARVQELLAEEFAEIKNVLGLPQGTQLKLSQLNPEDPELESWEEESVLKRLQAISPEKKQIDSLLESAKLEKKSKVWAFISGASAGNSARGIAGSENASFAFANQTVRGSFSFGLDYFPNIQISENQIQELKLRQDEVNGEMEKVLSSLLNRHRAVLTRFQETKRNELLLQKISDQEKRRYEDGFITFYQYIESRIGLRNASYERIRAETDLYLLWISAQRLTLSAEFSNIKGCEYLPRKTEERRGLFGRRSEKPLCDPTSTEEKFSGIN